MFKRDFSMYPYCEYTLLWSVQPLPFLSLSPSLPPLIIQELSVYIIISFTRTGVTYFDIVDTPIILFLSYLLGVL
jgi:hypothetical protein